jgi:hypothetical protein
MSLKKIFFRLYGDYFMSSRLHEYEMLIRAIKDAGYDQISVRDAWACIQNDGELRATFVHRHDIDTDVATAKRMFAIEQKYEVKSTFYFRLSTLDVSFMREIEEYGSEASYHYEELATFAKKNHIKSPAVLLQSIESIRAEFLANLKEIRRITGLPCNTVAAHGDFVNRKLGLSSQLILENCNFRSECDINVESYDVELMKHFNARISDKPYPDFWHPTSPSEAVGNKINNIFLLTHPRQWHASIWGNSRENAIRLNEGWNW